MPIVLADHVHKSDVNGLSVGRVCLAQSGDTTYALTTIQPTPAHPYGLFVTELTAAGTLLDPQVYGTHAQPLGVISVGGGGMPDMGGMGF